MNQQQKQSHPQPTAPPQTVPGQLSSSSAESPSASHYPGIPISTQPVHISTASTPIASTAGSSAQQNGHPTSIGGEVSTTMSSSQMSLTTTQVSYRDRDPNASMEQQQRGSHPTSTSALAASLPQPSPSSSQCEDSCGNPEGLSVSGQQRGYPPTTNSPQLHVPTNSLSVTQHNSGTTMTVQRYDHSLSGQITAMAISPPQVPPNSSHSTTSSASQSSYTASPGAMRTAQQCQPQHGYAPPPSANQIPQQHGPPPTYLSSSQPPPASTQRITSQQSYAASPDASMVQYHGHQPTPPSATSHVRPPQAQAPTCTSNFAYSGTSQQHGPHAISGTTTMTFRHHGHAPPPTASQFTTAFRHEHATTTSYTAPRGFTGQYHAVGGYSASHPYVPSQYTNPPPMQPAATGYSSLSSNFSSQAIHGSLASSTGSSYGSSPYSPYRGQQQHILNRMSGKKGERERERESQIVSKKNKYVGNSSSDIS